jgi:hypothetical protein
MHVSRRVRVSLNFSISTVCSIVEENLEDVGQS